jgi:hypothetical protein
MRAVTKRARQELPQQPKAATAAQIMGWLRGPAMHSSPALWATVLIGWFTTQRVGCIRQLEKQDIAAHANRTLSIRFRRGKVVPAIGPYTVHTGAIPEEFWPALVQFLTPCHPSQRIFQTVSGVQVKLALRTIDAQLEQRSLRRGAIQCLAQQAGMTNEILMAYTKHTTLASLFRYLNWGLKAAHLRQQVREVTGNILVGR